MRKNLGFTLIEAIICIALVAAGSLVLSAMFLSQTKLYGSQTSELDVTNSVRTALDDIDNYVRQSYRVVSSYSTYSAGSQVLILQIQSVNSSNQLIAGTYDYVVYYLDSGNIYRQVFADASSSRASLTKLVASNVTALTFTYNNASFPSVSEVATSITAAEAGGHQTRSVTTDSKARLRDY